LPIARSHPLGAPAIKPSVFPLLHFFMAVPLIKKVVQVELMPWWQKGLVAFSGAILIVVCAALFWSWQTVRQAEAALEARMAGLALLDEQARTAGDRLKRLKNDVRSLKTLLEQHVSPVAFIEFLEQITHPGTYWKTLEASLKDPRRIRLTGVGKTFESVAEQIERIRRSSLIDASTIGAAKRTTGGRIEFSLELVPKAAVWQFK
jgi:hypothetical protein